MPRGKELNNSEKQRIIDLNEFGLSQRKIAVKIGRSQSVVKNFLQKGNENYGKIKRSGRPPKISDTTKRAVLREISTTGISSAKAVQRYDLNCSSSLVRKWLGKSPHHKYLKYKIEPPLKEHHKTARLEFAEKFIQKGKIWRHVIFSDEKKFNLDGPDGLKYYWHDLRHERNVLSSRASGGGSVMVWAAFKDQMKSEIAFINGRINATGYQKVLEEHLLPFVTLTEDDKIIFQQDNAPIHTAKSTQNWFKDFSLPLMRWPALSPDLNPIENLWGILARDVYDTEKGEIETINELKERILCAWNNIPEKVLKTLVNSMPKRLLSVLKSHGCKTSY